MSQKRSWSSFEDRVREMASYIWSRPCTPQRIGGVNIDGVTILDAEIQCFVEITEEKSLAKVREDIIKLHTAKNAMFAKGIMARCFCVVSGSVTPAMRDAGKEQHVHVLSFEDFSKQFFDFETYSSARKKAPFGSSINPLTGDTDETKYVPVRYTVDGKKDDISTRDVANYLLSGKNVVLLGEYGSGKSRCIREVFNILSDGAATDFCHPVAIDLRKSWGLRQSSEMIRRHFSELGLDNLESSAVKAFNAKSIIFLLDGFDEIGSQAWSNDSNRLKFIRAKSLEGVKDIILSNGGGSLVAGREHYFPSTDEMFSALGMNPNNTVVIRSKNEFSDSELLEYFQNRDIDVDVPSWLPKRPLICQTIGELAEDDFEKMFGEEGDEISFWNHFINVLCQRDANIHVSFDPQTILRIFVNLARLTRTKASNVGPISLAELQNAFEAATGAAPVEEASVMLQRLPSLGRVGPESNDRQFVDIYILDGLRAKDIASINLYNEQGLDIATSQKWQNPLDDLGQRVLASDIAMTDKTKLQLAQSAVRNGNIVLASDVVAALSRLNETPMDFEGLEIRGGDFLLLPLDERSLNNLKVTDSYIGELGLPVKGCKNVQINGCATPKVTGVASAAALPAWITKLDAEEYDSVASVSRIKKIGLKAPQEVLITIIRKTFFQKGSGRKEEALLRGLGMISGKNYSTRILNIMIREGLLTTFRGNDGTVYSPVRSHTRRMQDILDKLTASTDPLWLEVDNL
ncbi:hypothetical protein Q9314_18345 [Shinella sumterensis]|nr:hypothetical protein Q9314_18345 [Shinella sumterensis]